MEKLDKIMAGLSIPVNTSQGSTPTFSTASEAVCPVCRGAGYLRLDVPLGHPNFGRLFLCECRIRDIDDKNRNNLKRLSNLDAFMDKTFESFDVSVPGTRDAFLASRDYARNPSGWLFLLGNYGCGKTHLAAAIANRAVAAGLQTYFAIAPDLLDTLRAAYAPNSESSYDDRFDSIRTVPLLVVDDLGTENTTPWAREKLYQIFNHRYNNRLPTVVTSNVDLDKLDPRIASRLSDQRLCQHQYIQADDYRTRTPGGRHGGGSQQQGPRGNGRKR